MHPHRSHWIIALAVLIAVGLVDAPVFAQGERVASERMTRAVEVSLPWKSQNDSHRSLEISPSPRDSHMPTAHTSFSLERRTGQIVKGGAKLDHRGGGKLDH